MAKPDLSAAIAAAEDDPRLKDQDKAELAYLCVADALNPGEADLWRRLRGARRTGDWDYKGAPLPPIRQHGSKWK